MFLLPSIHLFFSNESQSFRMLDFCQSLPLKAFPSASHWLYDLFLLSGWILTFIYASTAETHIVVHPTLTKMADPRSAMLVITVSEPYGAVTL